MVIDTSALVAILWDEPEAEPIAAAMAAADRRLLSAVSRVELSFVVEGRKGQAGRAALERLLTDGDIEVVSVTPRQAMIAIDAFRRYGKGQRHPVGLNIGDCFSYALASATERPLLFKGNDFHLTDIRPVFAAARPGQA